MLNAPISGDSRLLFSDPPLETAVNNCCTVQNMEACVVRCGHCWEVRAFLAG